MGKIRRKIRKFILNRDQFWEDFRKKHFNKKSINANGNEISININKPARISLQGIIPYQLKLTVPKKLKTCFVKKKDDDFIISDIFKETQLMEDIRHLNKENVGIIEIEEEYLSINHNREDVISKIVNNTPLNSKIRLEDITFYFLFNPPPGYGEALKYCNANIKTIYVNHSSDFKGDYLFDEFDCVIIHESLSNNPILRNLRRVDYFRDICELPTLIRKFIQDINARDYEHLLPIIGFNNFHQEELMNFDADKYDALVKIKKNFNFLLNKPFKDQCDHLSENIIDLAVTEKLFYSYSNLLNVPDRKDLSNFFLLALKDGMRITSIVK